MRSTREGEVGNEGSSGHKKERKKHRRAGARYPALCGVRELPQDHPIHVIARQEQRCGLQHTLPVKAFHQLLCLGDDEAEESQEEEEEEEKKSKGGIWGENLLLGLAQEALVRLGNTGATLLR